MARQTPAAARKTLARAEATLAAILASPARDSHHLPSYEAEVSKAKEALAAALVVHAEDADTGEPVCGAATGRTTRRADRVSCRCCSR